MTDGFPDLSSTEVREQAILEKFEGDPKPENLVERVHLDQGDIVKHEFFDAGELVKTIDYEQGGD